MTEQTQGFLGDELQKQPKETLKVFTDGGTVGQNGKLGTVQKITIGVNIPALSLAFASQETGVSNNVSEIRAMIRALEILLMHQKEQEVIHVFSDSRTAISYLERACRQEHLRPSVQRKLPHLALEFRLLSLLAKHFPTLTVYWIPREQNEAADTLTKIIYPEIPLIKSPAMFYDQH